MQTDFACSSQVIPAGFARLYFCSMKESWFKRRWVIVLLHIAFWSLLFALPFMLHRSFAENAAHSKAGPVPMRGTHLFDYVRFSFWVVVFYLNTYLLVPRFIYPKKYIRYTISLFITLALLLCLDILNFHFDHFGREFHVAGFMAFNFVPFCLVLTASTLYRMFTDRAEEEKKAKEKEAENLKTELAFLRSQISPHFMFNVLNNIVALARKHSDQVEPSLIKLSTIMRYFLYENAKNAIALEKELDYLKNYIELQEQRFGQKTIVQFTIGNIDAHYQIEPMLLIPFVENAFKHGIIQNGSICVGIEAQNGLLNFSVKNRYRNNNGQKDETSGIGLSNVKRRLDLLYANRHSLVIDNSDEKFHASLQLKLH